MEQEPLVRILLHHRAKLTGYIWSIVRDVHVTDDVFQDVCVRAIAKREEVRDGEHLLAWSRRVARDLSIDALRRRTARPALLDTAVLELLEDDWRAEDAIDSAEVLEALRRCIGELTPGAQQIVRMRYMQSMRGVDVARRLGRKLDTVYKSLTRIHRSLIECVDRRTGRSGPLPMPAAFRRSEATDDA